MAIYFFDKNQTLIKIVPESATFEAIQTQELDDDSLLKDTLSVTVKGDEKLLNAEYMAVKSYTGNAQTFDMYRIVTDTTPDKTMGFTGMSLAPYELNGHILQDLRPANQTISYTLNRVLDGTDWRVGYIDDGLSNVTTNFYYVSAKEALKELQSLVGCEFVFKVEISGQKITDKWVEVYSEMGNRTKKRFNYGTNALTVVRETNKADIYTALIGRGKGEEVSSGSDNASGQAGYGRKITFEDIEWSTAKGNPLNKPIGQYYLELPQATQAYGIKNIDGTMKARVGIVDFDDEEDKNRLINLTYQQLLVSSRPKVLFKTTVANIGATGIGDTVTIHRHDLNIHYQTRVRKIVRNKLNDNKTQIELGDAVVTASTKQTKQNNATIKNLNSEIEKIKANVTTSQNSADGKNTIFYGSAEPTVMRTGDTWYRPHPSIAGETQMLTWNGTAWELVLDTSDLTSVSRAVEDAADKADEAVQAAKDADAKANSALEKAGANANLLTTHQNTLDTINTVTLPDVASTAGTALADAKSAMDEAKKADGKIDTFKTEIGNTISDVNTKAQQAIDDANLVDGKVETFKTDVGKTISIVSDSAKAAMDEAKKTDGKITDYVTRNGLVSGTTVDTKINDATGAISKTIRTVESKIPTEIGARNYVINSDFASDFNNWHVNNSSYVSLNDKVVKASGFAGAGIFATINNTSETETYTISVYIKGTGSIRIGFESGVRIIPIPNKDTFTRINFTSVRGASSTFVLYTNTADTVLEFKNIQIEKGSILTDWKLAPEDNYTKEEFKIFEASYSSDVKGITTRLSTAENSITTNNTAFTTFKENDYKRTAERVSDTFTKSETNTLIGSKADKTQLSNYLAKSTYEQDAERSRLRFETIETNKADTTYVNSEVKNSADEIKTTLTSYAKSEDLTGLATETYASNQAIDEAGKVKNELTKYAKTTDLTGLASEMYATNVAVNEAAKVSNELTKYAKSTDLTGLATEEYALAQATTEAGKVEQQLTQYAKTSSLNGLATEAYATNKAVIEAGKVSSELTKYELKTSVDSKISTMASALRTETAEGMKTVYTKSETETLLGKKADSSSLNNYVQQATYTAGINGLSGNITSIRGDIDKLMVAGGRNYARKSNEYYFTTDYKVAEYNLSKIPKGTKIKISIWGGLDSGARTYGVYINNGSGLGSDNSQKIELTKLSGLYGQGRSTSLSKWTAEATLNVDATKVLIFGLDNDTTTPKRVEYVKVETGGTFTDWSPAPEDLLGKEEFSAFESRYNVDSEAITATLSELSTDKLDGTTYTNFYENDYKATAQGVKDAYTKLEKIVDENGNTTDTFAKAVYDQNATRRTESFNAVTKDLVKEATYTAGVNGLSGSISTISGQLDKLKAGGGGRNYALKSNAYYYTTDYKVSEYDLAKMLKGTKIKISIWGGLDPGARTFGVYVNNGMGTPSNNSQIIELTKLDGVHGQGVSAPLSKWTGEATLLVDATKILIFGLDNNSTNLKRVEYVKVETGETFTDWTAAPEDMLGKADFQVFKTDYEANDKLIKARLLAVDSGKEGSIAYRLNETEKTASGNTTTISDIKTKPGEQITGYQTIKERSELYERVIGTDEAGIKSNMARMVMTDSLFKTEVIKNVPSAIGGRNYVLKSNAYYYTNNYKVAEYDLSTIPKGTKIKISLWGGLGSTVRTFGVYINNSSGTDSGNSQIIELTKLEGVFGQGVAVPLAKWTAEATLNVDASRILIYGLDNNNTAPKRIEYVQVETGDYYTDWNAAPEDKADMSAITQLENSISLKVSSKGLLNEINVQAGGVLIQSGTNKLNVTPTTTYIENGTIKSAMIESLEADKIKTGTFDASKAKIINLDAESITANQAKLIQAGFTSSSGGTLALNGDQILSTASDGSQTTIGAGRVNFRNPAGAGLGSIGYEDYGNSPYLTLRTSWGSHFRITARVESPTGAVEDKHVLTVTADREMYLKSQNTYVTGDMTMQKAVKVGGHLSLSGGEVNQLSRVRFANGAYLEEQANGNVQLTSRGTQLQFYQASGRIMYSDGTRLFLDLPINMQGNGIFEQSDERIKTNIKPLEMDSLNIIQNVDYKSFTMIKNDRQTFGFIAQQMQELAPNIIHEQDGLLTYDSMEYTHLIGNALQQHVIKTNDEVEQLKAQIASLQDELALLKGA